MQIRALRVQLRLSGQEVSSRWATESSSGVALQTPAAVGLASRAGCIGLQGYQLNHSKLSWVRLEANQQGLGLSARAVFCLPLTEVSSRAPPGPRAPSFRWGLSGAGGWSCGVPSARPSPAVTPSFPPRVSFMHHHFSRAIVLEICLPHVSRSSSARILG